MGQGAGRGTGQVETNTGSGMASVELHVIAAPFGDQDESLRDKRDG